MVFQDEEENKPGLIIFGYPGVGKSSVITQNPEYKIIDLESSNFRDENGEKPPFWYKYYVNIAYDLAKQGNDVFLSTHEEVRDHALKCNIDDSIKILVVTPTLGLRDKWIERLENRYKNNPSKKNEFALNRAKTFYDQDVIDLVQFSNKSDKIKLLELTSTDYELLTEIDEIKYS